MSGWVLAWIVGAAVVAIVVTLLLLMIRGAARAAAKAEDIVAALEDTRSNTAGLWGVADTNHAVRRIVAAAAEARTAIEGRAQ